jgi:anti-sigma regulatory factor (Ser/Thr protein kinase)
MPPVPRAVADARRWVRETLARWKLDDLTESAVDITSELAANAITHATGNSSVVVLLMFAAGTLRLEVRDHDPIHLPQAKKPLPTDMGGRGLVIVEALSERWGVRVTDSGKSVWSELDVVQHAPPMRRTDQASGEEAWS